MVLDTSVYVHFPWCAKKCPYCDFASTKRDTNTIPHDEYADAVVAELAARKPALDGERRLVSVFFGGGTPSLWQAKSLGRVLAAIRETFDAHAPEVEVSVECNPNSLNADKARALVDQGVNRLSVGVQSLRDEHLAFLGRLHDRNEALAALSAAVQHVPRVSADLMFGMPRHSILHEEIDAVVATGVEHVSAYALTIEQGTQFGELHRRGRLEVSSDDRYAELFEEAESRFASHGFEHYEVSNYARRGATARHNEHYWRGGDYLGIGAAAVGCLSNGTGARRYKNAIEPSRYMRSPGVDEEESETLDGEIRTQEGLMLGLRTNAGVDLQALEARTGFAFRAQRESALARGLARGDLEFDDQVLRVPRNKWLLLDGIVASLF